MALFRFLFAPVLLAAVVVLGEGDPRGVTPIRAPHPQARAAAPALQPAPRLPQAPARSAPAVRASDARSAARASAR